MVERQPSHARRLACVALTTAGLRHARRLQAALPQPVDVYASARALAGATPGEAEGAKRVERLSETLPHLWVAYDGLALFFALGAAVRLIAPQLRDKRVDPAVVVVDDAARFAISVVSGHVGGANTLAEACAAVLGATSVITTASDVQGTLAVDLLGQAYGWRVEPGSQVTAVAAALANGESVAVVQEAGERDWLVAGQSLPPAVILAPDLASVALSDVAGILVITDRMIETPEGTPWVIYRPRSLVVGMGCRRGAPTERLDALLRETLAAHGLAPLSVGAIATANIKGDEPGLLALAERYDAQLLTFPREALAEAHVPTPSEQVRSLIGTPSVSEAAALLASEGGSLLVPKRKGEGCTVAIACRASQLPNTAPLVSPMRLDRAACEHSPTGGA